jgi:predicted DNA-binding transcriptional regulator YafY
VSARQANYLRSLPLHHSQQEIESTTEYSIFQLTLRPTYDFQQEILKNGDEIEVLEPLWLRNKITDKIKGMWNKYNQKEDI